MTTATQTAPWQAQIILQIEQMTADELAGKTHAVAWNRGDDVSVILHLASSEAEALVQAEDEATKVPGGEVTTAKLTDLQDWMADHESEIPIVIIDDDPELAEDEADETPVAGTTDGPDPEKGRLFDVKVKIDPTKPTVLKLAFSGSVDLDINEPTDVAFYNRLIAGKTASLEIEVHVAGAKKTHRRDSEGNVDAVVETKSLIVHSLDTE